MAQNHLIIGLGGTGGRIIRAFRKKVFEQFRQIDPEGLNLRYLYVDSSDEMMAVNDPSWRILGTSVQLGKSSQLLISDASLTTVLDNAASFPGVRPWIGTRESWRGMSNAAEGARIFGGQKRRLGRLLFAQRSADFVRQIRTLAAELQIGGKNAITFHVCCGLAGGTGSGSVVDAIAQIRAAYPDSAQFRIYVYALLPDEFPAPNWNTGNYHANGYAALVELNALSVGAFKPHDVSGERGEMRLDPRDPFHLCCLFTNETEGGDVLDVQKDVPQSVAGFLFQTLVAVRDVKIDTIQRLVDYENLAGRLVPENGDDGAPARGTRFLTFGIKQLIYPEEEIVEYLTYAFAQQSALQLTYNHWTEAQGFVDEARNQDFGELVNDKASLERWRLADDHITLSTGILAEEISNTKWRPILADWTAVIGNFKQAVQENTAKKASWNDDFKKMVDQRFADGFRGTGVRAFYQTKAKGRREHVREIRRGLERELFNDWSNGTRSMLEIGRLISAIRTATDERSARIDDRVTKARQAETTAAEVIRKNDAEWAKMGVLLNMIGRPEKLLDAQAIQLQILYHQRTMIEAWQFARSLLQDLVLELDDLRSEVERARDTITTACKVASDAMNARCNQRQPDLGKQAVQLYDGDVVRTVTRGLTRDKEEQDTQTARVRKAIIERLGENPGFTKFNTQIRADAILSIFEERCQESARTAHSNLIQSGRTTTRLLDVSVIDKLNDQFAADPDGLTEFVDSLVSRAKTLAPLNPSEIQRSSQGCRPGSPPTAFMVVLPSAPEQAGFRGRLADAFRKAKNGAVEIVDSDARRNELTLISVTNLFPIRFLKSAAALRDHYDRRTGGPEGGRARFELHLEGDGTQFPRLYVTSVKELDVLPYLLLGRSLDFVQWEGAGTTKTLMLITKDADGFDNAPVLLGTSYTGVLDRIDVSAAASLLRSVTSALGSSTATPERHDTIKRAILDELEELKKTKGRVDPEYVAMTEAGKRAIGILRGEA